MMIGFYATLFYKFGTGPHWDLSVGINRDYCRENWWLNLIYLNNYINLDKMVTIRAFLRPLFYTFDGLIFISLLFTRFQKDEI